MGTLWTKSMKASSPWGCAGAALAPDPGSKVGPSGRGHVVLHELGRENENEWRNSEENKECMW